MQAGEMASAYASSQEGRQDSRQAGEMVGRHSIMQEGRQDGRQGCKQLGRQGGRKWGGKLIHMKI